MKPKKQNKVGRPRTRAKGTPFDRAVGARIRELRLAAGMTQAQLAKKISRHYSQVYKYEEGQHAPTVAGIKKIADVLGCKASDLMEGT